MKASAAGRDGPTVERTTNHRRCGLFSPGSSCGDAVGLRSACEIIPAFAPGFARTEELLATLRANTAWRAHLAARALLCRAA